jgi:hypothetical protein
VCVCDSVGALARSRRVIYSCLALCCVGGCSYFFPSLGMIPACFFYSLKEVQGYNMLVRGAIFVGEGAQRPREGLIRWRRGPHCRGMVSVLLALLLHVQACAPLLGEWFLSFGVVAMRPVIPGPMAGVACSSL